MNLTVQELKVLWGKQEGKCAYTGIKMHLRPNSQHKDRAPLTTASLDRIDCQKPYILDNVQFVCKGINFMKNCHTHQEAVDFLKLLIPF